MTIANNKNTPRNTYTATAGQTAFTIGFEFFKVEDVKVYRNGSLLTYNASPSSVSQYKITGTASASDDAYEFGAGGTVTLGAGATADDSIVIIRDIVLERTSDFPTTGAFDITTLNTQLDTITSMLSDIKQQSDRSVKLLDTDTISATVTLPAKATRQDKVLSFDSSGNAETTVNSAGLATLSSITSDITTVAGISSDVTTVAGINTTHLSNVSGKTTEIGLLGTTDVIADMALLGTADVVADMALLADADVISDMNTLATSDIVSDLNQLATSDFVSDLNAVEGIKTDITTVANNVSSVNSFANQYRIGSSDPTTSLDEGDLFYNSTGNVLKYYNGSAWVSITSGGITSVAQDTTPQLGGNLDVNGQSIVSASNGNISITPNGSGKVIVDGLSHPTSDGSAGQFLKTDGGGNLSFATITTDLSADTTPQLGGNLDVQTNEINTSTTNGNVKLNPNGTGLIEIKGATNAGTIQLNCENNSHGIKLKSPPHSAAQSYTLTFPSTAPSADKILQTDGSGNLSFADVSGGTSWQSSVKTANFTATAGEGYFVDTSGGAFEIDLPSSPSVGDQIEFVDFSRSFASNNLTLDQGSVKFQGNATSPKPVYDTDGQNIKIVYSGSTQGWIPLVDDDVTMETPQNYSIDFLVVAGGGGTSTGNTGGGGAGGYRTSTQTANGGVVITVTVGDGGGSAGSVSNGNDSSISGTGLTTITSTGGGAGKAGSTIGGSGGSGGGSGYAQGTGGPGNTPSTTPSQGSNGAGGQSGSPYRGGGGGGHSQNGTSGPSGGHGGNGTANSITGSSVTYAGGGGASVEHSASAGNAGSGGGGAGGNASQDGGNGTANTGGGGGGAYLPRTPGQGGKGVVILSVPSANYSGTTSGSPTVTDSGSNKIIKFTGSGSYTT